MRCFSMEELCNRVEGELSKTAISKYERGKMMPDSASLIALASALEVPIDYLFRPFSVSVSKIEFRKKSKLGNKKETSIKEQVKDRLERYFEVEELLGIKPAKPLNFCNVEIRDAEDVYPIVEQIKEEWHIGDDGISNLIEVLEENDIKVIELDETPAFDGMCGCANDTTPIIVLNANFCVERKRFTALHELGHLVLNIPADIENRKREALCNTFANEMLISRNAFFQKIGANRKDISLQELIDLQKQYGISIDALMHKAAQTNVITPRRYEGYNKKKNKIALFKENVEKSRYRDEHTNRYERLVFRALASEFITISKASELLGKSVNDVREQMELV